ncbi:MAG: hypothetical protein WC435_02670 [Candidatus Paceibacterota bacterium]
MRKTTLMIVGNRRTKTNANQFKASERKKINRARNMREWNLEAERLGISLPELLCRKEAERDEIIKGRGERVRSFCGSSRGYYYGW